PSDQSTELTLSTSVDGEENTAEADDLNGTITAYYLDGNDVKIPLLVEGGKTTVPPFVTAVFVEVGTQQDSLYEGPEQFELLVSGKTGDTDIATAKGSTNIVDTATFQITGGNTVEEEGDYVFLGFNVVLGNVVGENVAFTLSAAIDGDSTTADASAGIDYADEVFYVSDGNGGLKEAEPSDLIVKAGETSTQVFVKVLDDDSYESNEVVGLTASTTSELVVGNTVSTATGVITDATDNPPEAEDFTAQVESSGRTFVQFDTGTGSIEGEGTDHISDTEDDADSQANVQVVITELPDHGTLWYNNIQITEADLYSGEGDTEYTQFDPNLIQYEPNADSEGFVLGVKDAQLGEQEANRTEFLNWGEATDKANERLLTLENGDKVTISSSNGPLVQYLGDPNADHVGYGIGAKNDGGIQSNETISITFDDRPADSVTLGLDGLGGWFDENLNTKDESSVQITVFYTIDDVESSETFSYQKSTAGDTNLFHEITIPSDGFTLPEGAEITKVDLGTDGNGNWELRYIETEATDTFDYRAVDSDGNFSDESTVTIGTPSSAPIATNDPVEFSVSLGSFNNDGSWSTDDGSLGEGAAISARYQTEDRDITDSGIKRGVSGHENGGIASQIQFNREDGESEQFIINLDKPVTEFSFTTSNLYKGEGGSDNHEQGKWVAYLDGVAVASDTFVANEGSNKGTYSYDAGDLEGVAFDSIVFESIDFVNTPARGDDSSDYFLTGFKASSEGAYAVNQGGILEIPASELLNNDTDPEGDSLRITYVYGETEGEARIENGVVYFDLDDDFVGTTTFEYQITDDNGGYDSATVNVIVNPAPIPAVVDSVSLLSESVPEGTDMAFKVNLDSGVSVETRLDIGLGTDTANDSDVDLLDLVFTNGVTYDANSNEIVIPVGVKDFTVLIPTQKDGVHELDETYSLRIGGEDGASATGTIENMDIPTLSVLSQGDVSEGSAATFKVNLSVPSDQSTELTL
ncbi:Ig-like domain-containing protein, partial [Vibrio genomosp. F10]|uniref:Ig-like domain-containing protein n=1 Tax=Vibrio genomosp. F10 TaxID=723171 RepID=UPI000B21FF62